MSNPPKLEIRNGHKDLKYGKFYYEFSDPELLMEALVVPIRYMPSKLQGKPPTYKDGQKLGLLGDSILKTIMATEFAQQPAQDMMFWSEHFEKGFAKNSFLGRLGEAIKISHWLCAADGERMTPDFWETLHKEPGQVKVNEKNKAIPSAVESLLGAIWMDCVQSSPNRDPYGTVYAFLSEMSLRWPKNEDEAKRLQEWFKAGDMATTMKYEAANERGS